MRKIQAVPNPTQQHNPTSKLSRLLQLVLVYHTCSKSPEEENDFKKQVSDIITGLRRERGS